MNGCAAPPVAGGAGGLACGPQAAQTLPDILGLIAGNLQADLVQLGIDTGSGYRRACFVGHNADSRLLADAELPPFVVMREARRRRRALPSGLVAAPERVVQRALPVGTAGRRRAPRSGIAMMRSPAHPAFKPSERRRLTQLLPYLNCAITLAHELECARHREAWPLAVLHQADCGYLLLSPDGAPLQGNPQAFELLAQARVRIGERLLLPSPALQARFEAALSCASARDCRSPPTLLAPGPPPVTMSLHPNPVPLADSASAVSLTLTLRGLPAGGRLPDGVSRHFGLTPAESRLCSALADGASLKACALRWNRSYETMRSQLKAVLAKTGAHRQAELVALLHHFRNR